MGEKDGIRRGGEIGGGIWQIFSEVLKRCSVIGWSPSSGRRPALGETKSDKLTEWQGVFPFDVHL